MIECMDEKTLAKCNLAAVFRLQATTTGIHAIPRTPITVKAVVHERFPIFQYGHLAIVDRAQHQSVVLRNVANCGSEPSAPKMNLLANRKRRTDSLAILLQRSPSGYQLCG